MDRRQFLTRGGAAAVTAAAGLSIPATAQAARDTASRASTDPLNADGPFQQAVAVNPEARLPAIPFHGPHQAGILNAPQPASTLVVANVMVDSRAGLIELFKTLTLRARFLTTGGTPENMGTGQPPEDSGTLGPTVPPDGLTITVGVGASLFDNPAFGISALKPRKLTAMTSFPNDDLQPQITGGDLILQICGGQPDTVIHALRDIAKHTRGAMQIAYRMDGFQSQPRPVGIPRNHFGHMDGIANPDMNVAYVANRLLWVNKLTDEPAWAHGGTYHVFRIIRMFIEFWDRVNLNEQQTMIGRYRASGAMLSTNSIEDIVDFSTDPRGHKVPLTAHIRLANPRTAETADSRIFRRGYNYDNGIDLSGNLDVGLLFNCFCQDLERQFVANQTRLIGEPMVDYISPVGGGYFFALPGVTNSADWFARTLFA